MLLSYRILNWKLLIILGALLGQEESTVQIPLEQDSAVLG